MTMLDVLVPSLKRALTMPGEFEVVYPNTSDADLTASLGDGFARCQLYGYFLSFQLDTFVWEVTPDLTPPEGSLVVLFTSGEIVKARLLDMKSVTRYKAGPVEYEVQMASSLLTELLKSLVAQRQELVKLGVGKGEGTDVAVLDWYCVRSGVYSAVEEVLV
jgi:hypothetical protein